MTTENHEQLPESACFEADGHVADVVVTCLADGEIAILPASAIAHVDACDACTARVGAEALLSLGASLGLLAAAREAEAVALAPAALAPLRSRAAAAPLPRKRRPLPIGVIAAALVVAVLGAAPGWMDSLRELGAVVPGYLHALPIWSHAFAAVLRSMMESRGGAILRWMIAAVFIGLGSFLARAMTRRHSLEGGLG